MIKVLHINGYYIVRPHLHQNMIDHLSFLETDNYLYAPTYDKKQFTKTIEGNICISECFKKNDRWFFKHKQKKIISDIQKKYDITKYNIIHAYTLFTDGYTAYQLSQMYGIPYIVAIRATDIMFFKYRINLRNIGIKILENASGIIFMSDILKASVLEKYVPASKQNEIGEKCHVITNGIDDYWLTNLYSDTTIEKIERLNACECNVICVAQIIKRKHICIIQEALEILRNEGWIINFKLIGKTVDKKEAERVFSYKNTSYIEHLNKEQLIEEYRKSDIFVLPSVGETFGLVYAEAISQGLPVIYSKNEGFDNQFPEGTVGYSIDPYSPEDVARKIKKVVSLYEIISLNCQKNAKKYEWSEIVKQYFNIYETIINKLDTSNKGKEYE